MKTVNILGKEYKVAFNFKTILAYEQLTGGAFDMTDMNGMTPQLNLAWCVLMSNNDDAPDYNDFLRELTPADYGTLSLAVASVMTEWYSGQPTSEDGKHNEEGEKNA